jgi:cell division transport system permease protein
MIGYFRQHAQALAATMKSLWHAPLATLLTCAVIAITLALPAGFYLAIDALARVSSGWQDAGRLSLFLKQDTSARNIERLVQRLRKEPGVASVSLITPEQALAEFRQHSGFGDALNALDGNPLPAVLVIQPLPTHQSADDVARLAAAFRRAPEIDEVIVDLDWVRRLRAWLKLAEDGVLMLGAMLGIAVLLIVGNTVRLAVLNRRDEIVVIKLIGGTDAFIRRPFLYTGALQGLAGGLLAWLLLAFALWWLDDSLRELVQLYHSNIGVSGPDLTQGLGLAAIGAGLGWLGSRLAVGRHLGSIEPV